jgi:hypothetical protein
MGTMGTTLDVPENRCTILVENYLLFGSLGISLHTANEILPKLVLPLADFPKIPVLKVAGRDLDGSKIINYVEKKRVDVLGHSHGMFISPFDQVFPLPFFWVGCAAIRVIILLVASAKFVNIIAPVQFPLVVQMRRTLDIQGVGIDDTGGPEATNEKRKQ